MDSDGPIKCGLSIGRGLSHGTEPKHVKRDYLKQYNQALGTAACVGYFLPLKKELMEHTLGTLTEQLKLRHKHLAAYPLRHSNRMGNRVYGL